MFKKIDFWMKKVAMHLIVLLVISSFAVIFFGSLVQPTELNKNELGLGIVAYSSLWIILSILSFIILVIRELVVLYKKNVLKLFGRVVSRIIISIVISLMCFSFLLNLFIISHIVSNVF